MDLPKRKSPRLKEYDYSTPGAYFITICNKLDNKHPKIFQISFHDHIIRGEKDYRKIWEYIDTNVNRWENDCFYK